MKPLKEILNITRHTNSNVCTTSTRDNSVLRVAYFPIGKEKLHRSLSLKQLRREVLKHTAPDQLESRISRYHTQTGQNDMKCKTAETRSFHFLLFSALFVLAVMIVVAFSRFVLMMRVSIKSEQKQI